MCRAITKIRVTKDATTMRNVARARPGVGASSAASVCRKVTDMASGRRARTGSLYVSTCGGVGAAGGSFQRSQDPVSNVQLGPSALSAIELSRNAQRQRKQGKDGGQRQGPQANGRLARCTKAAANGEADDRRPGVPRAATRLGHIVQIAPD